MARIRTIKPEFWTSEQVMECQPLARLLFIGIWNFCDDGGNHPASEKTIKAQVFPGDDIDSTRVRGLLDELSKNGLVSFYKYSGKAYMHVNGWHHQKIDRPTIKHPAFTTATASASSASAKGDWIASVKPGAQEPALDDNSSNDRDQFDDDSSRHGRVLTPGRDREGIGNGEDLNQEQCAANAPPVHDEQITDPAKRGTRLPKDWLLPADLAAWAKAERPELDDRMVKSMGESFRDFWVSKTGKGATKLDWAATWRNWVRNQRVGGNQRASPSSAQSNYTDLDQIDHTEGLDLQPDGTYRVSRP